MQPLELSSSKLPLHAKCLASTIRAVHPIATSGPEASLGTAFHDGQAIQVGGGEADPYALAKTQKEPVDPDELAMLLRRGKSLWHEKRDDFPEPMVEKQLEWVGAQSAKLKGRVDLISLIHGGNESLWSRDMPTEARIIDWSTSWGDPEKQEQIRAYGYLACRHWPSIRRVYGLVVSVRDPDPYDGVYYTREALEKWWMDFTRRLEREPLPYNPGVHCRFCPRALECPARMAMLEQAMGLVLAAKATGQAEDYVQLWVNAKSLQGELEKVLDLVRAQVALAGGSLPAACAFTNGEGYELRLVEQQRRTILPKEGGAVLRVLLGPALDECVTIHKTKVEAAARAQVPDDAPRGAKRKAVEELQERLEEAGAWGVQVVDILELKRIVAKELTP